MGDAGPAPQVPAAHVPHDAYLVDVREDDEWRAGHAPQALHMPMGELNARHREIDRERPVYVICRSGVRSAYAAKALADAGWDARNVSDGMIGWQAAGRPMDSDSGAPFVA